MCVFLYIFTITPDIKNLASDPCERLGPRVEYRLRLIARILDNITALLIKDHANREIRTARYAPTTSTPSLGPNLLQKMQEAETRLTATYPRLKAEATTKELLAHVSDLSTYEYWGSLCSNPHGVSGPTQPTALAVGNLRAECLEVYQCIWTKLEEQDAKEVLGVSDAIRFRLLSLESLLSYYNLGHQNLPRRSLNLKSSKPANPKVSKQLLRQHLEQSMLTALDRQAARPRSLVSLLWRYSPPSSRLALLGLTPKAKPKSSRTWISSSSSRT